MNFWKQEHQDEINRLNAILEDDYCNELYLREKLKLFKKFEEELEDAKKYFNFKRVLKYMNDVNWTWAYTNQGNNKVPTKEDLLRCIDELFRHSMFTILKEGKKSTCIATGGLVMNCGISGDDVYISLFFDISIFR